MEGLKLWIMTLIEYDKFGRATVLKSFSKPAQDSPIKQPKKGTFAKNKTTKAKPVLNHGKEEDLF